MPALLRWAGLVVLLTGVVLLSVHPFYPLVLLPTGLAMILSSVAWDRRRHERATAQTGTLPPKQQ